MGEGDASAWPTPFLTSLNSAARMPSNPLPEQDCFTFQFENRLKAPETPKACHPSLHHPREGTQVQSCLHP